MISDVENAAMHISREDAAKYLQSYRKSLRENWTATDRLLVKAIKAASDGKKVVDLEQVMRSAGLDERKRPRMAIARADWQTVEFDGQYNGSGRFVRERFSSAYSDKSVVLLPQGTFGATGMPADGQATVPMIPIDIRPVDSLSNWWILFEAEWRAIPRDPYLLKRIAGSLLFVIYAQWDLTDLEVACMKAAGVRIRRG